MSKQCVGITLQTTPIYQIARGDQGMSKTTRCGYLKGRKAGEIVEHHFAHASGGECQYAIESALRRAAKDILAIRKQIVLPEIEIHLPYTPTGVSVETLRHYLVESVAVKRKLGSIIPDVTVQINGREHLLEITETHGVDREKVRKVGSIGLSCAEIGLSGTERRLAR